MPMKASLRSIFACALVALAAGTSTASATNVRYDCKGGTRLQVQFSPPGLALGRATLTFAGTKQTLVLPQVMSADGGRYANGQMEFWIKGRQATLTRDGKSDLCTAR